MSITNAERRQRERYVSGGQWDDAILVFEDGTQVHSMRTVLYSEEDGTTRKGRAFADTRLTEPLRTFDLADVVRVHR